MQVPRSILPKGIDKQETTKMKTTVITAVTVLILVMMSGIAIAEIEEDWAYGRANVVQDGIESVTYDFEEGSNCEMPFKNQYPGIATFLDVPATRLTPIGYGPDHPSYVRIGGSSCGTGPRCYMNIYPLDRGLDWIYIVDGQAAFSPVTCCVEADMCSWVGNCCPGVNAKIELKEDTTYISFLASTGTNLYVRLYDGKGNWIHSETIGRTIDRVGSEPSNWTRFEIHLPDKEIRLMTLSGQFNGWHIDNLTIGGEPGYLNEPVDYSDVATLAEELHGVDYLEYGVGHDYLTFEYLDTWQFGDGIPEKYWNPETKSFEEGEGICNAGLIVWAYNKVSKELYDESLVKHCTVAKMEKHDFKIDVEPSDTQPGDVCFMDRRDRNGELGSDGYADEVYMVVEETSTGMDLIYSNPNEGIGVEETGVQYSKKSIVESSPAFMGYKRLPGVIRGGKDPIPKGH